MTALTVDLPRKSSRTSTQAMSVPAAALTAATIAATRRLSLIADSASGFVTASQKLAPPGFAASQTSAAIGSAITTPMNVATKPSDRVAPTLSLSTLLSIPPRGAGAATDALGSWAPDGLLDLDHPPVLRVEPLLVGRTPAADRLVVDRELTWADRELARDLRGRLLVDRPEAVLREHLLLRLG